MLLASQRGAEDDRAGIAVVLRDNLEEQLVEIVRADRGLEFWPAGSAPAAPAAETAASTPEFLKSGRGRLAHAWRALARQ